MSDAGLAIRTPVREIVATYQRAEAEVREAFAKLAAVETSLDKVFITDDLTTGRVVSFTIRNFSDWHSANDVEPVIQQMRRGAWGALSDRLELRRMMSVARWAQLERQLREDDWPEVTEANIGAFVSQFSSQLAPMLEEAIVEVFDWLRPRREDHPYKTNSAFQLGPKVIIPYAVEWNFGVRLRYEDEQRFLALENVFNALDGKGQIAKSHYSELHSAVKKGPVGETSLFHFRAFHNRNLHLTFKRLDLVAKINKAAGDAALKPGRRAA